MSRRALPAGARRADLLGRVGRPALLAALALGISLEATACGPARRSEPLVGEKEITDAEVARGQRVYARHCDECHPGGAGGLGPALNDKPLPGWLVKQQVRAGLGAMPSFPEEEISDPDLDALAEYVGWLRGLEIDEAGGSSDRGVGGPAFP